MYVGGDVRDEQVLDAMVHPSWSLNLAIPAGTEMICMAKSAACRCFLGEVPEKAAQPRHFSMIDYGGPFPMEKGEQNSQTFL